MLVCYAAGNFYQVRVFALDASIKPKDYQRFFKAFRPTKVGPRTESPKEGGLK
jgi:hypothetical protein